MAPRMDDVVIDHLVEEIRRADEWVGTTTAWQGEYELTIIKLRRHVGPVPAKEA